VNNPFLGGLILIALCFADVKVGIGCFLGGTIATASEFLLDLHPWNLIENGVAPFNGALLGSVITSLYSIILAEAASETLMWLAIVAGAFARCSCS